MSNDEQAIRDLVALWHSATAKGDVDTVLGLMAGCRLPRCGQGANAGQACV
jgi:hypothetical protein